jgi:hypothetical protein
MSAVVLSSQFLVLGSFVPLFLCSLVPSFVCSHTELRSIVPDRGGDVCGGGPSTPPLFLRPNAHWYQFSILVLKERIMRYDLLLHNALIVEEDGVWQGSLGVREGKIAARFTGAPDGSADDVIDAGGLPVLPGLVDAHVHFNEPGRAEWEGFECGSMGAAAGGVTTVIDMPLNNHPATSTPAPATQPKRFALSRTTPGRGCMSMARLDSGSLPHLSERI